MSTTAYLAATFSYMYKNSRGTPGVVLAAAAVAQFVFALDMSVVNVALDVVSLGESAVVDEAGGDSGEGEEVFRLALVA
ncbi:hypothetical protein ABZ743_33075, partial [Streptomyces sp. NPDC006662]|uniref:hypothetical protein n=1 Tax=Streptomyces sp. NPDC006662 TaxID=3156902 RepID=UPI0033D0757D